jgi:hypothetical protein
MDRNAKTRLLMRARILSRRTEPGKHYGRITAKDVAVLEALALTFHNAADGRCFPSLAKLEHCPIKLHRNRMRRSSSCTLGA